MTDFVTYFDDRRVEVSTSNNFIRVADKELYLDNNCLVDSSDQKIVIDDFFLIGENLVRVEISNYTLDIRVETKLDSALKSSQVNGTIRSVMAGEISEVHVSTDDIVEEGDVLIIISAMKMENKIIAPLTGRVSDVLVQVGDQIKVNQILVELEE